MRPSLRFFPACRWTKRNARIRYWLWYLARCIRGCGSARWSSVCRDEQARFASGELHPSLYSLWASVDLSSITDSRSELPVPSRSLRRPLCSPSALTSFLFPSHSSRPHHPPLPRSCPPSRIFVHFHCYHHHHHSASLAILRLPRPPDLQRRPSFIDILIVQQKGGNSFYRLDRKRVQSDRHWRNFRGEAL